MLASTKPGDVVLDPFFGSGTTGAVAKRLGRNFVGIEREHAYIDAGAASASPPSSRWRVEDLATMSSKRAEPRVAFVSLVDAGVMKPGTMLYDSKKRWAAKVRADGTLAVGERRRLDPPRRRRSAGPRCL